MHNSQYGDIAYTQGIVDKVESGVSDNRYYVKLIINCGKLYNYILWLYISYPLRRYVLF